MQAFSRVSSLSCDLSLCPGYVHTNPGNINRRFVFFSSLKDRWLWFWVKQPPWGIIRKVIFVLRCSTSDQYTVYRRRNISRYTRFDYFSGDGNNIDSNQLDPDPMEGHDSERIPKENNGLFRFTGDNKRKRVLYTHIGLLVASGNNTLTRTIRSKSCVETSQPTHHVLHDEPPDLFLFDVYLGVLQLLASDFLVLEPTSRARGCRVMRAAWCRGSACIIEHSSTGFLIRAPPPPKGWAHIEGRLFETFRAKTRAEPHEPCSNPVGFRQGLRNRGGRRVLKLKHFGLVSQVEKSAERRALPH